MMNEQLLESSPPSTADFGQILPGTHYASEADFPADSENLFANIDPITYRFNVEDDADNVAPSDIQIEPVVSTYEGQLVKLDISFNDPDTEDAHLILIDWDTFSGPDHVFPAVGNRTVLATHFYPDDHPSGTSMDTHVINVEVIDSHGGRAHNNTFLIVSNSSPDFVFVSDPAPLNENGSATLFFNFADRGTADQHTASIDWGDGSATDNFSLPVGERNLTTTHQYLDNNPTGTPQDTYTITTIVTDDDGGTATAGTYVEVRNVAPSGLAIEPVVTVDEHQLATLTLAFNDPGTQDTHTVSIDWGDGSTAENFSLAVGERNLTTTHHYLDDNPTGMPRGSYAIDITVTDDDGGTATAGTYVEVRNVAPSGLAIEPVVTIDEHQLATLTLNFNDPGTQDTHTVSIDWGDGSAAENFSLAVGERNLITTHQYLDDSPTGTPHDTYIITATVTDDDGGTATADTSVTVGNVAPIVQLDSVPTIHEDGTATLTGTITDPGTLDTFTVVVNWGDPLSPANQMTHTYGPSDTGMQTFTLTHQYLDDNPTGTPQDSYAINVTVIDDDGGANTDQRVATIENVLPVLAPISAGGSLIEGETVHITTGFIDTGILDTYAAQIDWGDGTAAEPATIDASSGIGTLSGSHVFMDQGTYTATIRFADDDMSGNFESGLANLDYLEQSLVLEIINADPEIATFEPHFSDEGQLIEISGAFTDRGLLDTHVAQIDWGDGGPPESMPVDQGTGSGSFGASHIFADDGIYNVATTVMDRDGGQSTEHFTVTVSNILPTLTVVEDQTVTMKNPLEIPNLGTFTDPGFNNAANPNEAPEGSRENFYVRIDWGDLTSDLMAVSNVIDGGPDVLTMGSFDGLHTYQDPALYTVTVTLADDDSNGDYVIGTFDVTVEVGNNGVQVSDQSSNDTLTDVFSYELITQSSADRTRLKANEAATPQSSTGTVEVQFSDFRPTTVDLTNSSERYFVLQVVNPDKTQGESYRIKPTVLYNLETFFHSMPNNRYEIWFVQTETNSRRLVLTASVRDGQGVDPSDESDGGQEKPPQDGQQITSGDIDLLKNQPRLETIPPNLMKIPQRMEFSLPQGDPVPEAPPPARLWEELGEEQIFRATQHHQQNHVELSSGVIMAIGLTRAGRTIRRRRVTSGDHRWWQRLRPSSRLRRQGPAPEELTGEQPRIATTQDSPANCGTY